MIRIYSLKLGLNEPLEKLPQMAAELLQIKISQINNWHIHKKALDARRKFDIHFIYSIDISLINEEGPIVLKAKCSKVKLISKETPHLKYYTTPNLRPIIIGFGPSGIFAAITLVKAGISPIIIEKGQEFQLRQKKVELFWQKGILDPNCNVQFGEGGAGAFSDGKLRTGIRSPYITEILGEFVNCGAPEEIMYESKPHIGTDILFTVVKNLRQKIISLGGEIKFEHTLTDINCNNGNLESIKVSTSNDTIEIPCDFCILATGHSAREIYLMLQRKKVQLSPKPFAMGLRIEHLQSFINNTQYGLAANHPALPNADYKMAVHLKDGRSVYTFCMCPGGQVVAAASEKGGVVVNGMSYSSRMNKNANSAILVSLKPSDFSYSKDPLSGMHWQRQLEQDCFKAAGNNYYAPAQLLGDFLRNKASKEAGLIEPSYQPGVRWLNLGSLLPQIIVDSLKIGIQKMDKIIKGFINPEAILTAIESRSSSPVRICRDENFQSSIKGLLCCGEGSGYSGGIISSAVDGIHCALNLLKLSVNSKKIREI